LSESTALSKKKLYQSIDLSKEEEEEGKKYFERMYILSKCITFISL